MKIKVAILTLIAFVLGVVVGHADEPITFKATDGREFKDVVVSRADSATITVMTDSGLERIPMTVLPADLQSRFGYDPDKAASQQSKERDAAMARTKALAAAKTSAARFARWDAELARRKEAAVSGAQDAATRGNLRGFESATSNAIKSFESKYDLLRQCIAVYDQGGAKPELTQRLIDAVYDGKVFIGMPKVFVLLAWGEPRSKDRSISAVGVHESWSFGTGEYLGLDDGEHVSFISH